MAWNWKHWGWIPLMLVMIAAAALADLLGIADAEAAYGWMLELLRKLLGGE